MSYKLKKNNFLPKIIQAIKSGPTDSVVQKQLEAVEIKDLAATAW